MRILYIEDDSTARSIFAAGIPKYVEDCEVEVVETAEDGLAQLDAGNFDLLVTDLMLPGKSGMDVLRECGREHPDLEVIVLTGHGGVRSAVEAMRLGARDYIEKPIDLALMRVKIENVRSYLLRRTELEDVREAKDVVERHADREVHLLEARVLEARDAIDEALTVLSSGPLSVDHVAMVRDILAPFSGSPEGNRTEGA